MNNSYLTSQVSETAEWFEEKMTFIKVCQSVLKEVNVYNQTVINFGKKYHRIYFNIQGDFPKIKKPSENFFDYQIEFFPTLKEYFSYTSKDIDENNVELIYEWIYKSCKIRLKNMPFDVNIKKYHRETDDYYSQLK